MVIGLPVLGGRLAMHRWPEEGAPDRPAAPDDLRAAVVRAEGRHRLADALERASTDVGAAPDASDEAPQATFRLLDEPDSQALPLVALAHAIPALLFACTADGRTLYVNRQWLDYTGLPDTEALGREWHRLVHPQDHARLSSQARSQARLARSEVIESRFRLRHASGEFRWHLSRARLTRDASGQPLMWAGTATEFERQKQVEEALDRREREFRTLVENAPDGITRLDPGLRHLYANQAVHEAFGLPPGHLLGRTAAEAGVPGEAVEAWRTAALAAFRTGEETECDFTVSAAGSERHFNCRLVPELDSQGGIESVLCIAYDVTHRRRALIALQDSELRFRQFAQSSEDVFWFADLASGRMGYVSPAFERLWGLPVALLQEDPRAWRERVIEQDQHQLPVPFFASSAGPDGHEPVREYRVRTPDGGVAWVRDRRFGLQSAGGRVLRMGGIVEDITERKLRDLEREELLARERAARGEAEALANAKDEFLAVVSHELRSPLNAIRGWAHVLRKTVPLEPHQFKPLDAIDRNVAAQARMVDDLLDTQRLLRGKVALDKRRIALPALIDQAVEAFRPAAAEKPLQLVVVHAEDLRAAEVDPERLRQALVNLLSNAVKFTPPNGRVEVRSRRCSPQRLAIDISDSGVGLDAEQAARLFEPFRQAGGSAITRRQGGLGLGLALARQLVELHGGRLTVASSGPDQGATFTLDLPALPPEAHAPEDRVAATPAPALAGKRIAVLDDDPEGRQILELLLRDEVAEAVFFASAAEGFDYLRGIDPSQRPDLLISDIAMPGEDGYSFIRRVRDLHRQRGEARLPAVALTAFASPSDRARALAAGFDAHLGKPLDPEHLRATLKELLRQACSYP